MTEPEPVATPKQKRPAHNLRKTSGRKRPAKVSDGGQDRSRDHNVKQASGKPATQESRKRRWAEEPPLKGTGGKEDKEKENIPPNGRPAYDGLPSSKDRKKNKTHALLRPNMEDLKTSLTRGVPTPPGTPVNRSPRTPSLQSLISKIEVKAILSQSKRFKRPDTPPEGQPFAKTEDDDPSIRYKLGRLLGRGAYGDVYLCKTPRNAYYAVKTLKPVDRSDKFRRNRQDREQWILELFRKSQKRRDDIPDCIIKFYETVSLPIDNEDKPRICHIMEWCQGPTLAQLLKRSKIRDPEVVKFISIQILQGLRYLEENRIVHCDMKPENIMLKSKKSNDFTIRIIDFGLSEQLESAESYLKHVGGTAMYHPPEAFGRNRRITCKIDTWAFGIILWEMLHGLNTFPISPISSEKARRKKSNEHEALKYQVEVNEKEFKKEIKFDTDEWNGNPRAVPLARGLLQKQYRLRFSAHDALKDKWLSETASGDASTVASERRL